jgi:hypothetical protein
VSDQRGEFHNCPEIRRELTHCCANPRRRTHVFRKDIPTEWQPWSVNNPETIVDGFPEGLPFTDESAWRFIEALLSSGWPMGEKALDEPPGQLAYELIVPIGNRELYIKLMPWKGGVYGRSFHWSTRRP